MQIQAKAELKKSSWVCRQKKLAEYRTRLNKHEQNSTTKQHLNTDRTNIGMRNR